jgi:hypothetical protein
MVLLFALWFARLADYERELSRQVRVLEGLLAICSFCKSIRNERGDWEHLESFISRRSEAEFSHGVCPSCGALHYPDMFGEERFCLERLNRRARNSCSRLQFPSLHPSHSAHACAWTMIAHGKRVPGQRVIGA